MLEPGRVEIEKVLLLLILQVGLIIAVARAMGWLARRLGQPEVIGEIVAGLLLGPSLFGWLAPAWSTALFDPPGLEGVPRGLMPVVVKIISQLGLILLLFVIGLEFDFGHLIPSGRATAAISLAGIALPMALGAALACFLYPRLVDDPSTGPAFGNFQLFLAVSMAITALPILGRLLVEWGASRTRVATIAISAAAMDDAVGWILLATIAAFVRLGQASEAWATGALMAALTVALLFAMVAVIRPVAMRLVRASLDANGGEVSLLLLSGVLVFAFACAAATSLIGIFAIFGAFLAGAILSGENRLAAGIQLRMRQFVTAFFLPIFFAYTGTRTRIGSIADLEMAGLTILVLACAVAGKFAGCGLAARLSGFGWREAGCIGVLMNTRALMELIVINVGKDLGVVPDELFTMLVIMALATTVMTTPGIMWLARGTEFEAPLRSTGWLTSR